jgi:hypothetical protein
MPLLNREPDTPYIFGLLLVLALIMFISSIRYLPFLLHEILGVH